MTPSQIWLADMHLLSPQCNEDFVERVLLVEDPLLKTIWPNAEDTGSEDVVELQFPQPISSL